MSKAKCQKVPSGKVFRDSKKGINLVFCLAVVIVRNTKTLSGKSFTSAPQKESQNLHVDTQDKSRILERSIFSI